MSDTTRTVPSLQINLLGPLEVWGPQETPAPALRPRAQRLLVHLLLNRQRAQSREQIAFTLYPDLTEPNALATLRRALSDLRGALAAVAEEEWILADGGMLCWNENSPYRLDVQEYERLLGQATPESLSAAAALYRGDLVRELDDEWLAGERERLRQRQSDALEKLTLHHHALGELSGALDFARRWLAHDPFAEAAHREVIALQYEMGDRAAALAHYERLRAQLQNELGVEPMEETRALSEAIARGARLSVPAPLPQVRAKALPEPRAVFGRRAELEQLPGLWDRAAGGEGGVVLVSGEAGIGKSHLAQSVAERVRQKGGLALTGHSLSFEQALPYQPILEMLRAAAQSLRRSQLPGAHRAALARFAPDVLGALGTPLEADASPGEQRTQLFEALAQSFIALAQSQPLVMIVEDAHWAAESTLDWLTYFSPLLGANRVLLLITHRTGEAEMEHALADLEQRLRRTSAVSSFALKPLSREANRGLVMQMSRLTEGEAQGIADRLYDQAGGNPFFVQELARGLIEAGQIHVEKGKWSGALVENPAGMRLVLPASLRATINARVENLTERARTFLRVAAVAGRVFDHVLVQKAGNWDDELGLAALEELLAHNFIRQEENASQFSFAHHLVQDTIYGELTAPRRAYLHRLLAGAVQEMRPDDFEGLAHHWLRGGDARNAVNALRQQAKRAIKVCAYADALHALEQASEVSAHLRQASKSDQEMIEQEVQTLLDRAALISDVGRSLAEYEQVIQAAGVLLEHTPNEHLQVQYYLRRAELLGQQAQFERAAEAAMQAHDAYLELGNLRGAAQGMYLAGIYKLTLSQNHAARKLLEGALGLYRQADEAREGDERGSQPGWFGITAAESWCLSGLGIVGMNLGEITYALTHLTRALELSERQGDKAAMARACTVLSIGWTYYRHAERMEFFAKRALDLYNEVGFTLTAHRPLLILGSVHWLRGEIARAEALYKQCFTEAKDKHDAWLEGWAAQYVGRTALERGDLPEAEHYFNEAYRLRHENGEIANEISDVHWIGRLKLAQGDKQAALSYAQEAVAQLDKLPTEFYVWEMADVIFGLAQALEATGDAEGASVCVRRAYGELMLFAEQIDEPNVRRSFFEYPLYARIVEAWEASRE